MYWGFSFRRQDAGLYIRHDSSVKPGHIHVPPKLGPEKISMIGNTKSKRNKKGPVSLAVFAYPSYECSERDRYLLHLNQGLTMVPVDKGSVLTLDSLLLDEMLHSFDKDCFPEFGIRFDAPSVDRDYLLKRIGFIYGATPLHCVQHDGRLDPTGVQEQELWRIE